MFQYGSCPRCQSELSEARLQFQPLVCDACGFTANKADHHIEQAFEKRFLKVGILIATVITASFLQAATWDKFAIEIIPLKIKQYTGMASNNDLSRIAQICAERLRHDCVETALAEAGFKGDNESFAALGKYQIRRMNRPAAIVTFQRYFSQGGQDSESMYQYAKALGETGQVDQAVSYYDQVLQAKPETLQITVTQNYVKMLVGNGRSAQALVLIEGIRKSGPSASMFMETEFQNLKVAQARR